eukprot:scaffold309459_cov37-Tisochrysis_lutea.AAC.3
MRQPARSIATNLADAFKNVIVNLPKTALSKECARARAISADRSLPLGILEKKIQREEPCAISHISRARSAALEVNRKHKHHKQETRNGIGPRMTTSPRTRQATRTPVCESWRDKGVQDEQACSSCQLGPSTSSAKQTQS